MSLKLISEKDIIDSFPDKFEQKYLKSYIKQYHQELSNLIVLIYVCGQCGGYDCGGIGIQITKLDDSFQWTLENDDEDLKTIGQKLTFKFNKTDYFKMFDDYLKSQNSLNC